MQVEERRTFPVALKKAWDYVTDFRHWPDWYAGLSNIIDPAAGSWELPGDEVRFEYRLLGRRLEGVSRIEEVREHEMTRFSSNVPGLPVIFQEWNWIDQGDHCDVLVTLETDDTGRFFEKVIEKTLLPRTLARDLQASLDNLYAILDVGMHE